MKGRFLEEHLAFQILTVGTTALSVERSGLSHPTFGGFPSN